MSLVNRMHILHVYQSPSFSGAEGYALEVAIHQAKTSNVTFLVKAGAPLETRVAQAGIKTARSLAGLELAKFDVVILHSTQELKRHWPLIALAKIKARVGGHKTPKVIVYTHIWISHSKIVFRYGNAEHRREVACDSAIAGSV